MWRRRVANVRDGRSANLWRRWHPPTHHPHLAFSTRVAHHWRGIVREYARHWRQVALNLEWCGCQRRKHAVRKIGNGGHWAMTGHRSKRAAFVPLFFCSTQFTQKLPTDLRLLRSNTLPHCACVISIGTHCVPFGTLSLPCGRTYFSGSRVGLLKTFSAFRSFGLILPRRSLSLRLRLRLRHRWDRSAQKWDEQSASEQRFCTRKFHGRSPLVGRSSLV